MTTENPNGSPAPTAFELFAQTERDNRIADAPAPNPPADTPPPTSSDPKLDEFDARLSKLDEAIQNAETGRVRKMLTDERDKLSEERTRYQLRDVLNATERESQPAPDAPAMNAARDGWQIDVPDTFTPSLTPLAKEYAEDMGRAAHDAGIPADEANVLFEFVSQHAAGQLEGLNIANEREVLAHMRHTYGETEASAIVTAAQAAFKKLPKGVQDYLDAPNPDNTRLTNSPSVLLMLALWGSGHTRLTPETATKELQRLRSSKEYVAGHKLTLEKARLLQTMLSRQNRAATAAPKAKQPAPAVAPSAKSKLEAEARTIRLDPGYTDRGRANHKQLVARMSQIMAELHPEEGRA